MRNGRLGLVDVSIARFSGVVVMSPSWLKKLAALLNGNPKRRRQLMVIAGVCFLVVALLEAVAPEWATVFREMVMLIFTVM